VSPEVAPPAAFDAESLAEYIEIFMLVNATDRLNISELRNSLPSGQRPTDADISFALIELDRRSGIAGDAYPYRVSGKPGSSCEQNQKCPPSTTSCSCAR
jgi:hypothetical protein